MLSGTDVSLAHDVRLGGSRWYGWWRGDCCGFTLPDTDRQQNPIRAVQTHTINVFNIVFIIL